MMLVVLEAANTANSSHAFISTLSQCPSKLHPVCRNKVVPERESIVGNWRGDMMAKSGRDDNSIYKVNDGKKQ